MKQPKIISEKTLSHNKYPLKFYEFEKPALNGEPHAKKNEIYFRPDGVTALLIDENAGKMLFTRQIRLATFLNGNESGYLLETCAGIIDDGETPEQTLEREAMEETGYKVTNISKVMQAYPSPGGNTEIIHFFTAHYDSQGPKEEGGGAEGEGEDIELVEMAIADVRDQLKKGGFNDLKTIVLLQHYFLSVKD